jgi:hypothetical protein
MYHVKLKSYELGQIEYSLGLVSQTSRQNPLKNKLNIVNEINALTGKYKDFRTKFLGFHYFHFISFIISFITTLTLNFRSRLPLATGALFYNIGHTPIHPHLKPRLSQDLLNL